MWQELIYNKYLKGNTFSQIEEKPTDSPFWKWLMRVKMEFINRGAFKIGNGTTVRSWEDVWLGNSLLHNQYPALYNIA
jgi:hypothetical protein